MKIDIRFFEGQQFTPIFEHESDFPCQFCEHESDFYCQFSEFLIIRELDYYNGAYKITPKISEQTMPTKDKSMRADITIFSIPYAETTNLGGGYTATIGG